MTKERLEELIKQEARVYTPTSTIRLHKDDRVCSDKEILGIKQGFYLVHRNMWFSLNRVYETKEQVEWRKKTYVERTERFEPPMWGDIKECYQFCWVNESFDLFYFEVIDDRDTILVGKVNGKNLFDARATKENYEKACEIVRDLFKGEK